MSERFGSWGHPGTYASPAAESRRLAFFRVSPEFLVIFIQELGQRRVTAKGIPADAKVVAGSYDPSGRCFLVLLESEEFEPVPLGAHPPDITVTLTDHGPYVGQIPESA